MPESAGSSLSSTAMLFDVNAPPTLNSVGSIRNFSTSSLWLVNEIVSVWLTALPLGVEPSTSCVSDSVTLGTDSMVGISPSVMVRTTVAVSTSTSPSLDVTTIDFTISSLTVWSRLRFGSKRTSPSRVINNSPSVKLNCCSPLSV
ncbi:hypothetical protein VCE7224_03042 [Vibrio celticus]|uniref:Uncharacterized protein n=1 Tax=Vibrio celticus TaxID=446372 RepID=A0A1C3JGG1_9VIBR|nr:hypothetical protein VCE7224_03042 [Vibrio celticus]